MKQSHQYTVHHARPHVARVACIMLALVALPTLLSAQSVVLGAKTGATRATQRSTFEGALLSQPGVRVSPSVALTAALRAWGPFSLQVEALYAGKGWTTADSSALQLDYLEMPVLLRIAPANLLRVTPVLLLGVAPALEITCGGEERPPSIGFAPPPLRPMDCNGQRQRRRDLGIVAAVGADIPVRSIHVTTELRYTQGLQDLTPAYQFTRVENRSMQFLVGLSRAWSR